jgi:two-component system sensor histidine kinase/response regulator
MNEPNSSPIGKPLLSRLTHHVRNPFNGIIGFTDLILSHYEKHSDADKKKYVQIVHHLSKKALLRSENLSWWLKHFTHNVMPVYQDFSLAELLNEEVAHITLELEKQDIELNFKNAKSAMIYSDKVMMQTIIRNILMNIVEFTPPAGDAEIILHHTNSKCSILFINNFNEKPTAEALAFINSINDKTNKH